MLFFLFTLPNLVWLSLMGASYFAAKKWKTMSEDEQGQMIDKMQRMCGEYPLPLVILIVFLVLRLAYAMGIFLIVEFFVVLGVASYIYRTSQRRHYILANQAQLTLQNTMNFKAILGNNLPEWIRNPSSSRVVWVNTMISGMWPSINASTVKSIKQMLPPLFERYKPGFVYDISLRECSLGNRPMAVTAIQHHSNVEKSTVLDFTCSWDSDMDISLLIKVPGPDMPVHIRKFEMSMKVRVTLEPHVQQWPCFAVMSLSIMKIWVLDFDISAVAIPLDAVPGLGSFLDSFIRNTLIGLMSYPKKMSIPILQDYTIQADRADSALGSLRIELLRVEEWQAKYMKERKHTAFYVKVVLLTNEEKKRIRSQNYKGLDSKLSDRFTFVIFDSTQSLRFWLYFDVPGSDVLVGECDIPLQSLMDCNGEYPVIFAKASSSEKRSRAKLIVAPTFLSYANKSTTTAPPVSIPSRGVSGEFIREAVDSELIPPTNRSLSNLSARSNGAHSGTLFICIRRCTGLKNVQRIGTSDPYVQLRLRQQTRTSPHVDDTLEPVFNYEAEMEVYEIKTDVLKIALVDKNVGKDKLMATADFPIIQILENIGDVMKTELHLEPQGKIFIELRLLTH